MHATAYPEAGPGIIDAHSPGRETTAGVFTGPDGLILVEIEETKLGRRVPQYAQVSMSVAGARLLRDLLSAAITNVETLQEQPA